MDHRQLSTLQWQVCFQMSYTHATIVSPPDNFVLIRSCVWDTVHVPQWLGLYAVAPAGTFSSRTPNDLRHKNETVSALGMQLFDEGVDVTKEILTNVLKLSVACQDPKGFSVTTRHELSKTPAARWTHI